jgi:DNA-binding XRE family transcriptional regulator
VGVSRGAKAPTGACPICGGALRRDRPDLPALDATCVACGWHTGTHRWISLDLARPLASLRAAAGLSQTDAADTLGCHRNTVASPEQRGTAIRLARLIERCAAFGLELEIRVRRR